MAVETVPSATSKIIEELNVLNVPPKTFTEMNVSLQDIEVVATETANTKLTVKSVPGRGYYNEVDIYYKRLVLGDIIQAADVRSLEEFTPASVVKLINGAFGLFLTVDDFEPFTPPTVANGESEELVLTAKPDSRGFIGSAVINLTHSKAFLDSIVGIKILPVRNHPDVVNSKMSARMVTWDVDFTSLRDAIKPTSPGQRYTDWAALQNACSYLGIPGWNEGYITDYPTSAVPDSNPRFDRVVVQAGFYSDQMIGPMYLHYNILEEA
jgi:hypothetical protein